MKTIAVKYHQPIEDLTGQQFGKWKVIEYLGAATWKCKCACGKELPITNWRLKTTRACNRCANALPAGEAAFRAVYYHYQQNAKRSNREFLLTQDEARALFGARCVYCDCLPCTTRKDKWGNGQFTYNGIDRKNNANGYISENCVSCCRVCNHMKHILSPEEFIAHVRRIAEHCGSRDITNG